MKATRCYDVLSLEDVENEPAPEPEETTEEQERTEETDCPEYADHEIGEAVRMACEGMTATEIAELIGLTRWEVIALLRLVRKKLNDRQRKRVGVGGPKVGHRPSKLSAQQWRRVDRLREAGLTYKEIAGRLGVSATTVRYIAEKQE